MGPSPRAFFNELIKINRQRLNLTKISIIAKDVSASAEQGLDLTSEQIYRLRTESKMSLLREHLKEYISSDVEQKLPERPFSWLPGSQSAESALSDDLKG